VEVLTIAIPTYNRPELLENLFLSIINNDISKDSNINFLVCDNSENELTQQVVCKYQSTINIIYKKNNTNIGAGKNVLECFKFSNSKYIHIVSDKTIFTRSYTDAISHIMANECDLAFLEYGFYKDIEENFELVEDREIKNISFQELIGNTSYKLTHLTSLFFKRSLIDLKDINEEITKSLIPQAYLFLDIASNSDNLMLVNNSSVYVSGNTTVPYSILDVFYFEFSSIVNKYSHLIPIIDRVKFKIRLVRWLLGVFKNFTDSITWEILRSTNYRKFYKDPILFLLVIYKDIFKFTKK